jgi:squalene synthase HpnC
MEREGNEDREKWEALAATHYENFPVGSFLVPKAKRVAFRWIYAFARTADDLADEARDLKGLKELRISLEGALGEIKAAPNAFDSLTEPLAKCIQEHGLSPGHFGHLLDAFELDLKKNRYGDTHELFSYCQLSANPVGRLVLELFEERGAESFALSDQICTGLQILNHLQDIRSDYLERNRVYLPGDQMRALGIQEEELGKDSASPALKALCQELAQITAALFVRGHPLCNRLHGRASLEIRAIFQSAALVLERLKAGGFDPLRKRPKVGSADTIRILFRALRKKGPSKTLQKLAQGAGTFPEQQ